MIGISAPQSCPRGYASGGGPTASPTSSRDKLSDPDAYLQFLGVAPDFAIFQRARRHPQGAPLRCDPKSGSRRWGPLQIRESVVDPSGRHVGLIDKIGTAHSEVSHRISRCFFRPQFTSGVASGIFEHWRILCNGRIALRNRELIPSREPPLVLGDRSHQYREVVARKINRARRRVSRSGHIKDPPRENPVTLGDGAILRVVSVARSAA